MDNHSQRSKRVLPNTPRVSAKIIEYYQKFGQDRDLEKFMRLYSPASSQDSEKTDDCGYTLGSCSKQTKNPVTNSSTNICEALAMMPQTPFSVFCVANSKSMPNIDVQGQTSSEKGYCSASEFVENINIETGVEKEKILHTSTENVKTPAKKCKNTKTQTPESVAKSHRRLEWDSLADVGYKKSMSTSNISTLEKSLLREFFKEKSVLSEPGTSGPIKDEQNITEEHKTLRKMKTNENEHSTPPLASSTLITKTQSGAKPKMITQSTSSTSLHKKFEKYAQTSILKRPTVRSQEIQCNMSSSNSIIEGTATPSSFEYYSKSSKSSDFLVNAETQNQFKPLEHPFITSIRDLLIRRKALGEKNEQKHHQLNNMCELHKTTKFQTALDENKENQSHSTADSATITSISLSKQAPELDLGIQLICSLVEAKSINATQKRQLIRDIIKRITRLQAGGLTSNSSIINSSEDTTTNSADYHQQVYDPLQSNINNKNKQYIMTKSRDTLDLGVSPITTEQVIAEEKSLSSTTNTSGSFNGTSVSSEHKHNFESQPLNFPQQHPDKSELKQFPNKKNLNKNYQNENNTKVSSADASLINKETQSELITIDRNKDKSKQIASSQKLTPEGLDTKYLKKSKENKKNLFAKTSKSSTTSTSSSKTIDLTTQKFVASINNENTDADADTEQPTMREWLNPLTQSEIEYEEKKQLEMKKKLAAQQEISRKKSKHDCGRVQQISWIENEMKRLACLKHLLLKAESPSKSSLSSSSPDHSVHNERSKGSIQTDKLYDTVYSDTSSVLSESAKQLVQEIEIILEESHEDVINLKDNLKRSKDRIRETQIMYKREEDSLRKYKTKMTPKLRIINENMNFYEEQLLNTKNPVTNSKQSQQREKIDTPSTDKSQESETSESLQDLVQQRKREFMEAYKLKKQHNYEALRQQQKGDFKYLNTQHPASVKTTTTTTTTTDSEHYSIPHTLPIIYVSNDKPYYTQHPLPLTPSEREYIIYKTKLAGQQQGSKSNSSDICVTTSSVKKTTSTDSDHYSVPHTQPRKYVSNNVSNYAQHPLPLTPPERAAVLKSSNADQQKNSKSNSHEIIITSSADTNNTPITSSSSVFCMSSDVSVPMGSQTTSSTSTTTHQYDDVATAAFAAGVAVQTSDSILRSKPIYGPKPSLPTLTTTSSTTACIQVKPKGIAYVIEFDDNKHAISNLSSNIDINSNEILTKSSTKSINSATTAVTNNLKPSLSTEPILTLQEYLERSKPTFLQRSKERKAILNQLQSMRQDRDRQLREIIGNTSFNSLDKRLKHLPPPPIQKARILKTKEMKALTNKRFAKLPEVVAKKEREFEEKRRRSNRILRDVFNMRLQKRVRNGKLSLNHSKTVI